MAKTRSQTNTPKPVVTPTVSKKEKTGASNKAKAKPTPKTVRFSDDFKSKTSKSDMKSASHRSRSIHRNTSRRNSRHSPPRSPSRSPSRSPPRSLSRNFDFPYGYGYGQSLNSPFGYPIPPFGYYPNFSPVGFGPYSQYDHQSSIHQKRSRQPSSDNDDDFEKLAVPAKRLARSKSC